VSFGPFSITAGGSGGGGAGTVSNCGITGGTFFASVQGTTASCSAATLNSAGDANVRTLTTSSVTQPGLVDFVGNGSQDSANPAPNSWGFEAPAGTILTPYRLQGSLTEPTLANQFLTMKANPASHRWTLGFSTGASVSVSDYGCLGDGTTNDLTCFNNAIAATPVGGSLFVPIPSVNYNIVGTINLNKAITIQGLNSQINEATASATLFNVTSSNVQIINLNLQALNPGTFASPLYLIKLTGAKNVVINGLYLLGATTASGTDPTALTDTGILLDSASNARIVNNIIEKFNIGVNCVGCSDTTVDRTVTMRNIVGSRTSSNGYGVLISNNGTHNSVSGRYYGLNYPTNNTAVMRHAVYISSGASYNTATQVYAENTVLACLTSASTAAQGQQVDDEFSDNILVNCVQADVTSDAAISFYGYHRSFVANNNIVSGAKGNGIADNGLSGDATHLCEKDTFSGNNVYQVNYTGIEIAGCFNDIFVGNYSFNNSQKSVGTYYGIALTNTPLGGSAVAGSPANNRFVGNYSWGTQQGYALADLADHPGVANEINANYLNPGATGAILDGNSALVTIGNYTTGTCEQQNIQPRFIGSSVRGIAVRNGI
jgi:hypothetical protein